MNLRLDRPIRPRKLDLDLAIDRLELDALDFLRRLLDPLDPNDTEIYALISKVRDTLDELATALEERGA